MPLDAYGAEPPTSAGASSEFRVIPTPTSVRFALSLARAFDRQRRPRERTIMSKVFINIALSLDGYMAPEGMSIENWDNPQYKNWAAKWGALMAWLINLQYFRENLKFGPGGETGPINDMVRSTTERIGANIMGKRMFDQGERSWPADAPFHTPVYVLTHEKREPWVRPGGTTFFFVNDGPERALELARESAGDRDVRLAGGANLLQQFLNMDVVDELEIALAPVLFGAGRRLFENLRDPGPQFRIDRVINGPAATHLRYVRR
jgi:dihydrofolate reductase